ncbi:MAG TPA: hypothetical protein VFE47_10295 [Tepidisphaeraceae bacterium]|jgi:hypothetical protein|nr:hypothetical protein [Tepidisphaeraceae bacterium]
MIFDALRTIASNWLPDIKPLVDAATLLYLPVTPHDVLPRKQDLETMSEVAVNFRLPYPIIAVEDNASCVVLIDPRPDLTGLVEQRLFIDCVPLDADEGHYNDTPPERALCESLKPLSAPGVYAVSFGRISCPAQLAGSWLTEGEVLWVVTGTQTQQHTTETDFHSLPESANTAMLQAALRNAMTAIEEVIAICKLDTPAS